MLKYLLTSLFCLLLAVPGLRGQDDGPPTVAIFGRTGLPIDDHLRDLGWQTLGMHWGKDYTLADLKPFQVVVIGTYPHIREGVKRNQWNEISPEYNERFQAVLDEYVAGGGGLLLPACMHPTSDIASTNSLLARWDAKLLLEQVVDPVNTWVQTGGMGWTWYWTENIAEHPTTAGVKTLFYPHRHIYVPASWALRTGKDWTVLVRGADTARSLPVVRQQERMWPLYRAGKYGSNPPMVATRQLGKGRIVASGWAPVHCWFNLDHFMVENVFFSEGSGEVKSDGLRWLEQTLAWLAEPAAANGYGGYENQPNHPVYPMDAPLDWAKVGIGENTGPWQRGIIGARSARTGGQGSVADYAAAAREAGLDFIAFLEDFSQLDPAGWDAFRAECQAATTDDLLVLPGALVRRGRAGTEYFVVSDFPWPQADMLGEDNRIVNYLYAHFNMGLNTHGPLRVGAQLTPPWMSRAYNSQAVVTTVNGESTWELEPYLYNVRIQDAPKPVAVDLITSPEQVAAAAGRVLNYRQCATRDDLRRTLKNPDAGRPAQIGNGPLITTFQGRNTWPMTDGRYVPGRERWQFRIIATSDRPLKELVLYDGTRVFRRYELTEPRCDIYVDGLHDRQYQLTAVVTDRDGRVAVRGPMQTADQFNRRTMCSDRQNSIGGARQADANGNMVAISSSFLHGKFQQHGTTNATPASASTVSWVPWYWDGSPGSRFGGSVLATMIGGERPAPEHQWMPVYRMDWLLGNRDVIVQAAVTEGMIDKNPHDREYSPVIDIADYRAYSRFIEFKKTPDAPTSMLIEGYYETLTDGVWPEGGSLFSSRISHAIYSIGGRPREDSRWIWRHPTQEDSDLVFPEKAAQIIHEWREVHPDGYTAFIAPQSSIALFALDQPLGGYFWLHRENWLRSWFGLTRVGETYQAGDRQPFRMLVFTGSVTAPTDTAEIERFRRAFGLDGQPPVYSVESARGRVLGTRFVLELAAQDGGWQGTIGAAELPHRLPLRVHGVNPHWTCGLVDLDSGDWRPLDTLENLPIPGLPAGDAAYVALDLGRDRKLWIGNLLLADAPELRLTLVPDGAGGFAVQAHNPTPEELRGTVRATPGLVWAPDFTAPVVVPAGATVSIPLAAAPQ